MTYKYFALFGLLLFPQAFYAAREFTVDYEHQGLLQVSTNSTERLCVNPLSMSLDNLFKNTTTSGKILLQPGVQRMFPDDIHKEKIKHSGEFIIPWHMSHNRTRANQSTTLELTIDSSTLTYGYEVFVYAVFFIYVLATLIQIWFFVRKCMEVAEPGSEDTKKWSALAIWSITSFRFYCGFLSTTWLPFLIPKEGGSLYGRHQAFFIVETAILLAVVHCVHPFIRVTGVNIATISSAGGHRLLILSGVVALVLGFGGCFKYDANAGLYFLSMLVMKLGEGFVEVTTETACPTLVSEDQFPTASTSKRVHYMLGGIVGAIALILDLSNDLDWLYYSYTTMTMVFSIPLLTFLHHQISESHQKPKFVKALREAYVAPLHYSRSHTRACVATLILSVAFAPIFYVLLMIRDVVGVESNDYQEIYCGIVVLCFFAGSCIGKGFSNIFNFFTFAKGNTLENLKGHIGAAWVPMLLFVFVLLAFPTIIGLDYLISDRDMHFWVFCLYFSVVGGFHGFIYSQVEESTWTLMPSGVSSSTIWGFQFMCRLIGFDLGCAIMGLLLETCTKSSTTRFYKKTGYAIAFGFCSLCAAFAAGIMRSILSVSEEDINKADQVRDYDEASPSLQAEMTPETSTDDRAAETTPSLLEPTVCQDTVTQPSIHEDMVQPAVAQDTGTQSSMDQVEPAAQNSKQPAVVQESV